MKFHFVSTCLFGLALAGCTNITDTEQISRQAEEARSTNQSVEESRQKMMSFVQLSSQTGFDSFISSPKKHSAQELIHLYSSVNAKYKQRSELPELKHQMLYSLINNYKALDNKSVTNSDLLYYLSELKAMSTFDASLALSIVNRLNTASLNTEAKASLADLRDELAHKESAFKQDIAMVSDPKAIGSPIIQGSTSQSVAMQNFIKNEYIKAVKKNCMASLELLTVLKSIPLS